MARRTRREQVEEEQERIVSPVEGEEDAVQLGAVRPLRLDEFGGQPELVTNLRTAIDAARVRGEPVDHVILHGPPGLGKTTLAQIIANEMRYTFRATAAPAIGKPGDLAAVLSGLEPYSVLFIDEIHRLPAQVEEILYSAMEDFKLDLLVGEGMNTRTLRLDLPPFTLVGATTRLGALTHPLRDRFGIQLKLELYAPADLERILVAAADRIGDRAAPEAIAEIARRARGTPRIAHRLYRRVRDFAHREGARRPIRIEDAVAALRSLGIDDRGLDKQDRAYLRTIGEFYAGGPVGIETLAATLGENAEIFETVVEPYLLSLGLLNRTPRGRMLTRGGWLAAGLQSPETQPGPGVTGDLFGNAA